MRNILILVFILLFMFRCSLVHAQIPPQNLWKGVEGEAVGEGYKGMVAVTWVYHNRLAHNMRLGCCALHRKDLNQFILRQGARYEKMAQKIVGQVFNQEIIDPTNGATYYEDVQRYGMPYWAKHLKICAHIGHHVFFK